MSVKYTCAGKCSFSLNEHDTAALYPPTHHVSFSGDLCLFFLIVPCCHISPAGISFSLLFYYVYLMKGKLISIIAVHTLIKNHNK